MAMTKSQKITLGVLSAIAGLALLLALYTASQAYRTWSQRPLGPTLAYPTQWELPATWTASPGASPQPALTHPPTLVSDTATPASPFLSCNDLPSMTILAIGSDSRSADSNRGLSDLMRAVRVDFREQKVTALEFPRDLWVKIPGIERNLKTDRQKLNTAFAHGGSDYGPSLLARTLDLNFGLQVDHYVVVNMNVFVEVVDALGGLEVILPREGIDGRTSTDRSARLVFPGGPQILSGEQALTLARMRNVSVFERAEHQNTVMCALQEKIERPETLFRLPAIIDSFIDNIQTDLTPEQISQLACLGTTMPRSNITFTSFPLELFKPAEVFDPLLKQDVFIWDANFGTLRGYVERFEAGTWPVSTAEGGTPEPGTSSCE
jgi:polyisoprenyl-teichoic acid--peptidoglycan teichoic acid transferase